MKKLLRLGVLCALLVAALCVSALAADTKPDGYYTDITITAGTCVKVSGKTNSAFTATVTGMGSEKECLLLVTTADAVPTANNVIYVNQAKADAEGKATFTVIPMDMNAGETYYIYATSAAQARAGQTPATFGYIYSQIKMGDVNQDKTINSQDALGALKIFANPSDYTEDQITAANVNGDDTVNAQDALGILILGAS